MSRPVFLLCFVLLPFIAWLSEAFPLSIFGARSSRYAMVGKTELSMARRKTRVKRVSEKRKQIAPIDAPTDDAQSSPISSSPVPSSSSSSSSSSAAAVPTSQVPFDINTPSQLAPLKSTAAEKQRKYEEKSAIQRQLEDLLAPTPAGQDPKLAVLAKQVTWVAVIVLVLIEIFVSVKTGGMPFSKEAVRF